MFSITFLFDDPGQISGGWYLNQVFDPICDLWFQIVIFKAPCVGPWRLRLFRALGRRRPNGNGGIK